jgi:large subunit ribosomal protein L4
MAQITLKTAAGKDAGNVELDDAVFAVQPNVPLMHQVVTAQLAGRRAGTQSTKTRSEVRGGGAKPYRQKGTGNARQGSTNAPHYTGGGVALGPKPRDYRQRTPKKMIKAALRSALSDRASEGRIVVVDEWGFAGPKTRDAKAALAALGIEGRALVVISSFETPAALSFRNLPEVQLIKAGELNAYDVLCNDWIVFEQGLLPTVAAADTGQSTDDTGQSTDDTQAVTASAPDRSTDETATAEGSASDEAESSEERSDGEDHSA